MSFFSPRFQKDQTHQIRLRINEAKVRATELQKKKMQQESGETRQENAKINQQPEKSTKVCSAAVQHDQSELRLFVKNLRPETSEQSLKTYFSRWGHVSDLYIRQPNNSHREPRCAMAFITFSSYYKESPLNTYLHVIDGMSVPIFKVALKPSRVHSNVKEKTRTIMVSGSIHNTTEKDLIAHFSRYGQVVKVIRNPDRDNPGSFKRFAFIYFAEAVEVDRVIEETIHAIKGQTVDVRRVDDRN